MIYLTHCLMSLLLKGHNTAWHHRVQRQLHKAAMQAAASLQTAYSHLLDVLGYAAAIQLLCTLLLGLMHHAASVCPCLYTLSATIAAVILCCHLALSAARARSSTCGGRTVSAVGAAVSRRYCFSSAVLVPKAEPRRCLAATRVSACACKPHDHASVFMSKVHS